MLDPTDKAAFDGLVTHLRENDPRFCRHLDRMSRPKRRLRTALAILLWTVAPLCVVYGGWTGLLLSVLAVGYGSYLFAKRNGNAPAPAWWTAQPFRPSWPQ
ncbi:hypothetical protein Ade02nite_39450 [Paractinoplanes deccanensis]|uniref:DUF3040 domain-containing protein n=1 Tax=Paractinoplanes deccanensis TaxID=113561 RepID=A0ABQ3Y5N5_9ACTN|nr:DUF3040 domain-containing protein [Actinoplanes deccanensis]GID75304.1 hypothetical protein Ade02nite_39450 [Actinoplanes deccanensis]